MSDSHYTYNAPQFYTNLSEATSLSEEEDDFFDAKEEKIGNEEPKPTDIYSENKENVLSNHEESSLNDSFSQIKIKNKFEGIDLALDDSRKSHPMLTRQDITIMSPKLSLELRNRSVFKDGEEGASQRLKGGSKRKVEWSSSHGGSVSKYQKYQSLAEMIYHFQKDTPPRFKGFRFSKNKKVLPCTSSHPSVTVPESPHFLSGQRLRHCSDHGQSQEERELQEIEEAKQKFKPQQLNKKIFDPPKELDKEKHFTVPKPFKLTEPQPKKKEKEEIFVFKAKPFPHQIFRDGESVSRLPVIMEEKDENSEKVQGYKEGKSTSTTKVVPFSFEERDKLKAIRKHERMKKIVEEEKKATVFRANPLPTYFNHLNETMSGASSTSSYHRHEMEEIHADFKARPATVLKKKPFQVKKSDKSPTRLADIKLSTEVRAQQRQEFDEFIKNRMNRAANFEEELNKKEELKIQEEISKMRKETVHKPLPLPASIYKGKQILEKESSEQDTGIE